MNAHSENEHDSVIMESLSQTQIVTNLLRLQNTTFQTCSLSKFSPIIPRLIFKASLFSLSPPTTNPRTSSTREREEMRGAFKSSVPWVVGSVSGNLSHPVYAGQISARDRRELAGPLPGHNSSLSFLSAACLPLLKGPVCKPFHTGSFLSTPSDLKQTGALVSRPRLHEFDWGGLKESYWAGKCGQITQLLIF